MSNPRRIAISYTVTCMFEIPEGFPVTAKDVREIADWKTNNYTDGRHPFSTELMHDGAQRAAAYHLSEAIFQHYARRVERAFPLKPGEGYGWRHIQGRDKLAARCEAGVRPMGIPEHQVTVSAKIYPPTEVCPQCGNETPLVDIHTGRRWKTCPCGGVLPSPLNKP